MSENLTPIQSDEKFVAHYMMAKCKEYDVSQERLAQKSNSSIDTVRNICSGKTTNPGIVTIGNMVRAVNGSMDEMCFGKKSNENANVQTLEAFEHCILAMQEQQEKHEEYMREHYAQHRQDYKEHTEHRLADKREIIAQKDEHIKSLKKELYSTKIFSVVCIAILVGLLILEVTNPSLGWIKF